MVYVSTPEAFPELLIVSAGIFPVPEAVNPDIPGVALAVHAKVVPATFEVRIMLVSV